MNNIDPYNNAPQGSTCGRPSQAPSRGPPQMPGHMAQPPAAFPPMAPPQAAGGGLSENQMLRADLQVAIDYIHKLGGRWPPPGH